MTSGNNSKLIREAMSMRNWWVEIPNVDSAFNFKWQPVSYRMKFRKLNPKSPVKQIVNHFENHRCLTEKSNLYFFLQNHCEFIKTNVFDIMPVQFFVKVDMSLPNALHNALLPFVNFFNMFEEAKQALEGLH